MLGVGDGHDRQEASHPMRGDSAEADDLVEVVLRFCSGSEKLAVRACSKRLLSKAVFSREEADSFVEFYFSRRREELVGAVKRMFVEVGTRNRTVPCYPFFVFGTCDCHTFRPFNPASHVFKNRHHDGERGKLFPKQLSFLREAMGI